MADPVPEPSVRPPRFRWRSAAGEGPDWPVLAAIGIAGLAAIVLVRNLLPARRDLAHTLQQEATLREQLDALNAEKALLEDREKALREDPTYIERVHRAQTGMTRPGEFIVR